MSSAVETQSSFDDVVEDASPTFPLTVSAAFSGARTVARAFRVDGGGNITVKTAAGESRTLTDLEDPFFDELKITEITSVTAANKVRFYV
jgi:hypothetical protein